MKLLSNLIERLAATILLILLFPVFLIISILIRLDSKGPILFKQKRVTINGNYFYIYKFRSMRIDTPDVPTNELISDGYITKMGKVLRITSLDELPQLMNIIKGDMSFVGPRPLLYTENEILSMRHKHGVDTVLPGITGWAQINGRDNLTIEEKVKYDYEYVQRKSILFDIYILFLTVYKVFKKEGIREVDGFRKIK